MSTICTVSILTQTEVGQDPLVFLRRQRQTPQVERVIFIGLTLSEIARHTSGLSPALQTKLKQGRLSLRFGEYSVELDENHKTQTLSPFEPLDGFFELAAKLYRVSIDQMKKKGPLSAVVFPYVAIRGDAVEIRDCKIAAQGDCVRIIHNAKKAGEALPVLLLSFENGLEKGLAAWLYRHIAAKTVPTQQPSSLVQARRILPQFYEDPVLRKFVCVITKRCLRFPVADRKGNLYEKAEIEEWLSRFAVSPVTATHLRPSQLVAKDVLQALITHRLELLDRRLLPLRAVKKSGVPFIHLLCGAT